MQLRPVMIGGVAMSLALAASLGIAAPASAAPTDPRARDLAELKAASDRTPVIVTDGTGVVTSLRTAPGHPVERPAGVRAGAGAELTARALVREYAAAFGLGGGDRELRTESTRKVPGGMTVVRFRQTVGNLPVLGGDLVTTVRPDGGTVAVNSTVSTATTLATAPTVSAARAAAAARSHAARVAEGTALAASAPELVMFDPALFGAPMRPGLRPVWKTRVTGASADGPVAADVLVDARTGRVTLSADALRYAKERTVCDHGAKADSNPMGMPGELCRDDDTSSGTGTVAATETTPPADGANAEVARAFDAAGRTYDLFHTLFGRDSVDAAGKKMRISVRYCPSISSGGATCYPNAFWDGEQAVFGPGYALGDDVVAHELTHGVVEHTADLFYWYQSGAINESMADVFGELVDQFDAAEGAEPNWLIGEDLPNKPNGFRSMSNPEAGGDPAGMTSPNYKGEVSIDPAANDYGGVHSNSGVGNNAAYRIATGLAGTSGETLSKTAHLYYETLTALPSGADYAVLARTLQSSCSALVGAPLPLPALKVADTDPATVQFTSADCAVVNDAISATQMTADPVVPKSQAPEAPVCPDGSEPATTLFADDMESRSPSTWSHSWPDNPWFASTDYFHRGSDGDPGYGVSYATSGKVSLIGFSADDPGATTTASRTGRIQKTTAVTVPTGAQTFLWFAHADSLTDGRNDGARVSVAYADGSTTRLEDVGAAHPSAVPAVNGYNGTLAGDGQPAFVGDSHGYVSTRIDLSRFAGKAVKPTFDIVGNATTTSNWWIDDVRVYTCGGAAPSIPNDPRATPSGSTVTLTWKAPEWAGSGGLKEYVVSEGGTEIATVTGTSYDVTGVSESTYRKFTVTAVGTDGTRGPSATLAVTPASTLNASPATVAYGGTVTLSGTVTWAKKSPVTKLASRPVLIQAKPAGTSTWSTIASRTSNSSGAWTASHKPTRNVQYRVLMPASTDTYAAESAVRSHGVAAKVTANFRSTTVRRGTSAVLSVGVAPGRKYTVELQRRSGTRWVLVSRRTTTSSGTAAFTVKHSGAGKYSYRVVSGSDTYYRAGISSTRVLTVR